MEKGDYSLDMKSQVSNKLQLVQERRELFDDEMINRYGKLREDIVKRDFDFLKKQIDIEDFSVAIGEVLSEWERYRDPKIQRQRRKAYVMSHGNEDLLTPREVDLVIEIYGLTGEGPKPAAQLTSKEHVAIADINVTVKKALKKIYLRHVSEQDASGRKPLLREFYNLD